MGATNDVIEVVKAGLQTSVQDGGRPGYLGHGIPPAGAQDTYSLRAASLLVGNAPPPPPLSLGYPGDAAIETALLGPGLRFEEDAVVALTGAVSNATVDGAPLPMWESVLVRAGSVLDVGTAVSGVRGYLAVAGGIDVPVDLGSRSTSLQARRGGYEGRKLEAGDRLPVGEPSAPLEELAGRVVHENLRPSFGPSPTLRVVLGPQDDLFLEDSVERFLTEEFTVSSQADRMASRLTGPELPLKPKDDYLIRDAGSGPADVVDDTSAVGAIQVPGGVALIIMGVEVPTAGGYAKIATVISADLGRIGQVRPGGKVRFEAVDHEQAVAIGIEYFARLDGNAWTATPQKEVAS